MNTFSSLFTALTLAVSALASAQVAGTVPRGGQPAGVVPPMNPYLGTPYPTPYSPYGQPWWRPVSSVPVFMAGFGAPVPQNMTYVIGSTNEWERLYREMFPPLPFEQVHAPALTSFSSDVLIVLRLAQTADSDLIPTLDGFEQVSPYTTVVRYSIWTRLAKADEKQAPPVTEKKPVIRAPHQRLGSPYVVARAPRVGGQYQFSGMVQYYQPFNYGDRRSHR